MRTDISPDHRLTFQETVQSFCDRILVSPAYRPATQSSYSRSLKDFSRVCADVVYADELRLAHVKRFHEDLQRRQLRVGTRHTRIAAVKAFFAYLEAQGVVSADIAHTIMLPVQGKAKPVRPVDVDEAALLMRVVNERGQSRDVALMEVLLHTGISFSELTELSLADVKLTPAHDSRSGFQEEKRSTITSIACALRVRSRGASQQQEVQLDETTWQALNAYLAVRPAGLHPQLFLTEGGTPLTLSEMSLIVKKYARAARMPWIHARAAQWLHSSPARRRHTFT